MSAPAGPAGASGLFRVEAIEAVARKHDGEPSAACGISMSILMLGALTIAGGLIAFACNAEYTRKARVQGFIEPASGLVKVRAPAAGNVAQVFVKDGDSVRTGDSLLSIDTDYSTRGARESRAAVIEQLEQQRARLHSELESQRKIDRLEQVARESDVKALDQEIAQLDRELGVQRERVASARRAQARFEKLKNKGHVAAAAVDEQRAQWLDRRTQLESLKRERLRVTRERDALMAGAGRATLENQNARSRLQRELSVLEQEITEQRLRRSVLVTAPGDGVVSTLLVRAGQRAGMETALLTVVPAGAELQASLMLPSHAAGFVQPNQGVRIRYAAFPHQRFGSHGGVISRVSRTLLLPGELELPVSLKEPAYLVRVKLDEQAVSAYGARVPLKAGMRLEADVELDRRRIVEWLLDPLLGLRGRLRSGTDAPLAGRVRGS